jgi:serine/threonine protein kinase
MDIREFERSPEYKAMTEEFESMANLPPDKLLDYLRRKDPWLFEDTLQQHDEGHIFRGRKHDYILVDVLHQSSKGLTLRVRPSEGPTDQLFIVKVPLQSLEGPVDSKIIREIGAIYQALAAEFAIMRRLDELSCVAHVPDFGHLEIKFEHEFTIPMCFLVQQYVHGKTLNAYMEEQSHGFSGIKKAEEWFKWASKIVDCVRKVHEKGVVHGNLHPKNIIIDEDGNPVLIDFRNATLSDVVLGGNGGRRDASRYVAPERWKPNGIWHTSADIYSLGGILFYLATGNAPPVATAEFYEKKRIENTESKFAANDEVKNAVVRGIKEANPDLYIENPGIADIVARCLRASHRIRTPHVEALLEDLETFNPSPHRLYRTDILETIEQIAQQAKELETKNNLLYRGLAKQNLRLLLRDLERMTFGLYELMGDHEDITGGFSRALSMLDKGDQYLTISIPSFWHPHNLGINGRFLAMHRLAAQRGVTIRRVFIISDDDEKEDTYLSAILQTQQNLLQDLSLLRINIGDRSLDSQGVYIGVNKMSKEKKAMLLKQGYHCGMCKKGSKYIYITPDYREGDDAIVKIRFQESLGSSEDFLEEFNALLSDSKPLLEYSFKVEPEDIHAL